MLTSSPAELELAARLRLSVTRLARRLRQESVEGLTPSQTSALASLDRRGALTPRECAAIERFQRPRATRVLASLQAAGLVVREVDPIDKRVARVRVSPEGAAL